MSLTKFNDAMKVKRIKTWRDVLCYKPEQASQSTVRRHYLQWRQENGMPIRCDDPKCNFNGAPLIWNNKSLPLILDHINGNRKDNRPEMLRLLCPNCDSQLSTRGGANRGRVQDVTESGFTIISRAGTRSYTFFPSGGFHYGGSAAIEFKSACPDVASAQ